MSNVNFKGFMVKSALANWIAVRKICDEGDPSLPMMDRNRIFLFH